MITLNDELKSSAFRAAAKYAIDELKLSRYDALSRATQRGWLFSMSWCSLAALMDVNRSTLQRHYLAHGESLERSMRPVKATHNVGDKLGATRVITKTKNAHGYVETQCTVCKRLMLVGHRVLLISKYKKCTCVVILNRKKRKRQRTPVDLLDMLLRTPWRSL